VERGHKNSYRHYLLTNFDSKIDGKAASWKAKMWGDRKKADEALFLCRVL